MAVSIGMSLLNTGYLDSYRLVSWMEAASNAKITLFYYLADLKAVNESVSYLKAFDNNLVEVSFSAKLPVDR